MTELTATQVELCSTKRACRMQSNDFASEKVVTVRDVGGDLDVHATTAGVKVLDAPGIIISSCAAGYLY